MVQTKKTASPSRMIILVMVVILITGPTGCGFLPVIDHIPSGDATEAGMSEVKATDQTRDESLHPADVSVFFTTPGEEGQPDGITELIASIQGAQTQVRMAMYNFSLDAVGEALLAAHKRGIQVQMVMESDALDGKWPQKLQSAGIEILGDGREELMHHKFIVIDDREVWTGSWNLTGSGTYSDNNNMVRMRSREAAKNYTTEFLEMFEEGSFGREGQSETPYPILSLDGSRIEFYFSPEDHAADRVVELVRGASERVELLAYSFTLNSLGSALKDQHDGGLRVRIVCDQDQMDGQGAECPYLRKSGLDVRLDGIDGLMHDKVIVIDGEIVILGSFNFTRSADERNDENLIIVHDADIAGLYLQEFERIYKQAQD